MFRFRKKIKLGKWFSINLNKSTFGFGKGDGPSITNGGRGLGLSINKKGVEGYASAKGTGLECLSGRKNFKED
ncbi:DUF4236 domain-containing protein [Vibrio europaeus]|uniref:DUF4236 domain-containing protein n=1 Tax=Vibrio europaeus TaxID=300876 RepID=UPI00148B37B8|nr:DUF4236 domain-containing protein [Vibrio europaeus]NOH23863.1 DUF4236 domain-containing protein [Vibrio europaeus]